MKNNLAYIDVNIPSINNFVVSFNNKSNLWINISNIDNITGHIYKHIDGDMFYNLYELSFNSHIKEKLKVKIPTTDKIININGYNIPETLVKEIKEVSNSILDYLLSNKSNTYTDNNWIPSSLNTRLGKLSTKSTNYEDYWLQPLLNKKYKIGYTSISVIFHDTKYPFNLTIRTDYTSYITIYYKQEKITTITKNIGYNNLSIIQQLLPVIYDLYDYHVASLYTPTSTIKSNPSLTTKDKKETTKRYCTKLNNEMVLAAVIKENTIDYSDIIPVHRDYKHLFKLNTEVNVKIVDEFKEQWCEAQDTHLKKIRKFKLLKPTGKKVAKILTLKP